jgi:uncharacterized protein (DUF952 family)
VNLKYIYKIINKDEWQKTLLAGFYSGSSKDLEDGYIHFSDEEQVEGTLKKYYSNQKNLVLLKVDTLKLEHLLWEQGSDGNMFPHLYSKLDIKSVVSEDLIDIDDKGSHVLPVNF